MAATLCASLQTRQLITQHLKELNQGAMHCPVGLQTLHLPVGSRPHQPASPSAYNVSAHTHSPHHTPQCCPPLLQVPERHPWVYLACGHVHGPHEWRAECGETNKQRTCTICREVGGGFGGHVLWAVCVLPCCSLLKVGPFVRLSNGEERSYCLDMQPPTHAFVPCGHMCSENTAK